MQDLQSFQIVKGKTNKATVRKQQGKEGIFFIITFWIIKKEFDNSAPAQQGGFFSADVSPTNQITAFLQK